MKTALDIEVEKSPIVKLKKDRPRGISFDAYKDKTLGEVGTPKRDRYEKDLQKEIEADGRPNHGHTVSAILASKGIKDFDTRTVTVLEYGIHKNLEQKKFGAICKYICSSKLHTKEFKMRIDELINQAIIKVKKK